MLVDHSRLSFSSLLLRAVALEEAERWSSLPFANERRKENTEPSAMMAAAVPPVS